MIKIILIALGLLIIAMAGMGIRMLFDRNAEFSGGSCSTSDSLKDKGITCGCGGQCASENEH